MVSPSVFLTAATLLLGTFASPVRDVEPSVQALEARGKADIVREILKAIGVFTDNKKNAWVRARKTSSSTTPYSPSLPLPLYQLVTDENAQDFKANKDMCDVFMRTKNGGNCFVSVECQEGGKIEYYSGKQWENCRVQGREFIYDPRIGEFRYGEHNSKHPTPIPWLLIYTRWGSLDLLLERRASSIPTQWLTSV